MILERIQKDELVKAIYESSNIVASTYNKNNKDLNIIFKHGGSYTYQNVSESDYMRFETADSQGKILNSNLKSYAFLKHDNVDIDVVIKKIKTIKRQETSAMELGISKLMEEMVEHFRDTTSLDKDRVGRLTSMLSVYNQMIVV
tara:strand:+ start:290 stop:721 length:432 start_codon:yes stop_codon:yes gene_type:complete